MGQAPAERFAAPHLSFTRDGGVAASPIGDVYRPDSAEGLFGHAIGGVEIFGFIAAFPRGLGFFSLPEVASRSLFISDYVPEAVRIPLEHRLLA